MRRKLIARLDEKVLRKLLHIAVRSARERANETHSVIANGIIKGFKLAVKEKQYRCARIEVKIDV